MQFLKQLLSIGEVKVSALILSLFASLGCGIYITVTRGDIPPNLSALINTLVFTIAGVNVVHGVGGYLTKTNKQPDGQETAPRTGTAETEQR